MHDNYRNDAADADSDDCMDNEKAADSVKILNSVKDFIKTIELLLNDSILQRVERNTSERHGLFLKWSQRSLARACC